MLMRPAHCKGNIKVVLETKSHSWPLNSSVGTVKDRRREGGLFEYLWRPLWYQHLLCGNLLLLFVGEFECSTDLEMRHCPSDNGS